MDSLDNSGSVFRFVLRGLLSTLVYRRKNTGKLDCSAIAFIIWRNLNQTPNQETGSKLAHIAAHLGHYALYAVMILMPLTGYIGTGVNTEYFYLFDIPKFESSSLYQILVTNWMGLSFKEFEAPIDYFHKDIMGKWAVWILIAGHVMAAMYHHFVKKDRTLIKMTTG